MFNCFKRILTCKWLAISVSISLDQCSTRRELGMGIAPIPSPTTAQKVVTASCAAARSLVMGQSGLLTPRMSCRKKNTPPLFEPLRVLLPSSMLKMTGSILSSDPSLNHFLTARFVAIHTLAVRMWRLRLATAIASIIEDAIK